MPNITTNHAITYTNSVIHLLNCWSPVIKLALNKIYLGKMKMNIMWGHGECMSFKYS